MSTLSRRERNKKKPNGMLLFLEGFFSTIFHLGAFIFLSYILIAIFWYAIETFMFGVAVENDIHSLIAFYSSLTLGFFLTVSKLYSDYRELNTNKKTLP